MPSGSFASPDSVRGSAARERSGDHDAVHVQWRGKPAAALTPADPDAMHHEDRDQELIAGSDEAEPSTFRSSAN